jgi:hypothetical protein
MSAPLRGLFPASEQGLFLKHIHLANLFVEIEALKMPLNMLQK